MSLKKFLLSTHIQTTSEKNKRNFNGAIVLSTKMPIKIPYRKKINFFRLL